jgi:hypothetical protein
MVTTVRAVNTHKPSRPLFRESSAFFPDTAEDSAHASLVTFFEFSAVRVEANSSSENFFNLDARL